MSQNQTTLSEVGRRLLAFGYSGKAVLRYAGTLPTEDRMAYLLAAFKHFKAMIATRWKWRALPVDMRTFLESPEYLNQKEDLYPAIVPHLIEMNNGTYVEAILTGGIGSAKSTCAVYSMAFQVYIMSCLHNPQREFGLGVNSEIVLIFQSKTKAIAEKGDYARLKALIDASPYFQEAFPYNKAITSELQFPKRLYIRPLSGDPQASIGQNIMGGVLEEVNFMGRIEKSKQSVDGGAFDQAVEMYNSIVRRRKTRFMKCGVMPGLVCVVSSKRYPGEFTEVKADEAKAQLRQTGKSDIYVYDKRVWEIKPEGTYSGVMFNVFAGDTTRKPRVLDEDEVVDDEDAHLVMPVPMEYKSEFDRDLLSAIRDIAGMATLARHPFILDAEAVAEAFGKSVSVLSREDCDFVQTSVQIFPKRIVNPAEPRFVHIDLSVTSDSTGVAIGHVEKFMEISRGAWSEVLPVIVFDAILEVAPPRNGEIEFAKIRTLLYKLRELGMNIKWVSLDTYQSRDTMQILAGQGFTTGAFSLDTDPFGYDLAKTAFYDRRVKAPLHAKALKELVSLERDPRTAKVNHRADGSKDVSDAMAGVIYGLTTRREIWHRHKISITKIPGYLTKRTLESLPALEKPKGYMQSVAII